MTTIYFSLLHQQVRQRGASSQHILTQSSFPLFFPRTDAILDNWITALPADNLADHYSSARSDPWSPLARADYRLDERGGTTERFLDNGDNSETDWSCNYLDPGAEEMDEGDKPGSGMRGGDSDSAADGLNGEGK